MGRTFALGGASTGEAGRAPAGPARAMARRRLLTGWAFLAPAAVVILGLSLFPAMWAVHLSTQKTDFIVPGRSVGFDNYRTMADDPQVWQAVRNTLFYTALYVPLSMIVGLALALALHSKIRFQGFYRTCIFVPFVASSAATGILATFVFNKDFGIANRALDYVGLPEQPFFQDARQAMVLLVVVSLWGSVGFNVVVSLAALQSVPGDIVEAARVDGAYRWGVMRHVVLPELTPVLIFQGVWGIVNSLQFFDLILTTTNGQPSGKTNSIVFLLYEVAFKRSHRYGYGAAIAVALAAVCLLIALGMVRYGRRRGVDAF